MDSIGFSIIIPCYNAQKYIEKCLDSVLAQPYKNFEVILVNDGSTDRTKEILNQYEEKDKRITVVHKPNQGVSSARNDGLRLARKEYVMFLDSDDFMVDNILSALSDALQSKMYSYDILIGCNMMHYYESTNTTKYIPNIDAGEFVGKSKESIMAMTIGNPKTLGIWAVWRHVYRRDLIMQYNLFFDVCYGFAEDMDWLIKVMQVSEYFTFFNQPLCYYRHDNADSASNQYSVRLICNHIEILAKWIRYFENSNYSPYHKKQILRRLANKMMTIPSKMNHLKESDFKLALQYLQQYQSCLRHVHGIKFQAANFLVTTIGLKHTAKLLSRVNA